MYEYLKAFVALANKWVPHWKQSDEFKTLVIDIKKLLKEQKVEKLVKQLYNLKTESVAVTVLVENMKEEYNEK